MKITKDLQNYLGIISVLIQKDSKDILCYFERFNNDELTFQMATSLKLFNNENIYLQFNFADCSEHINACVIDFGINYIVVKLDKIQPLNVTNMINKLNKMILNDQKYGRRKEPRIKLGLEYYENFSLASKSQVVFSKTFHFVQPCVIKDVSMHGICFITPYNNQIKLIDNYKVKVSFINPDENIIIDVHKVHVNIKLENDKKIAIISGQILEPIHYIWKQRVVKLL